MAKKVYEGTVVSTKMAKTLVVLTPRRIKDARVGKTVTLTDKYKVHCEASNVGVGDLVSFVDCRPISKQKKWRYLSTLKKAPLTFEVKEDV